MMNRIGSRGPAPTPTALREKYGIGLPLPNEPKPQQIVPEKPDTVAEDEVASKEWDWLVKVLYPLGLLTEVDGKTLGRYCFMASQLKKTERLLLRSNVLIPGDRKNLVRNPAIGVFLELNDKMLELEKQFGLTPSSRTRITVPYIEGGTHGGVFAGMKKVQCERLDALPKPIQQEGGENGSAESDDDTDTESDG